MGKDLENVMSVLSWEVDNLGDVDGRFQPCLGEVPYQQGRRILLRTKVKVPLTVAWATLETREISYGVIRLRKVKVRQKNGGGTFVSLYYYKFFFTTLEKFDEVILPILSFGPLFFSGEVGGSTAFDRTLVTTLYSFDSFTGV